MIAAPSRWRTLGAFVVKEVQHVLRDRQTLAVLLLMPLVQVLLFGAALRTDVRSVRLAIVDPTPDAATLALRGRLAGNSRFILASVTSSAESLEPLFRQGRANVAVVLPTEFSQALARGDRSTIQVITDATDPNSGSTMQSYVLAVISDYEASLAAPKGSAAPMSGRRIELAARMRYNPTLASANLFVPGLIALVITMVAALMTAISLSREKERGTLEILLVSPLRPWQIIVGKVIPYMGLGLTIALTVLYAARIAFHVPMLGSQLLLLAESLLFTIVSLSLGVMIAAITGSQRAAMLTAVLVTMLPTTLLSGMIFPIASMPKPLQVVSHIVPARWFIVIARGIMLKGIGLGDLVNETAILGLMAVVLLVVATRSFNDRLA